MKTASLLWSLLALGAPLLPSTSAETSLGNLPGLLAYDRAQVKELLTGYGPIDLIFFDSEATDLRNEAWALQPNIIVTRGAIPTPEQTVPGRPMPGPWEANLTMGRAWQYPLHLVLLLKDARKIAGA